jgi:hypothetical protein
LIFMEGGKPENPEKNPRSKGENQQQTQLRYDNESGNCTRVTVVRALTATPPMLPMLPIPFPSHPFQDFTSAWPNSIWLSIQLSTELNLSYHVKECSKFRDRHGGIQLEVTKDTQKNKKYSNVYKRKWISQH